jgi:hypothetical protein
MKICFFCCEREIPYCKYNHPRQNCCGEEECLEKRRRGYRETEKAKIAMMTDEVKAERRDRANLLRRKRRRTARLPMLPRIIKACVDDIKRITEPLQTMLQDVVNQLIRRVFDCIHLPV